MGIPKEFPFLPSLKCAFAFIAMVVFNAQAQLVIDNFDNNQALLTQSTAGNASSTATGSMLGGERDQKVTVTAGAAISAEIKNGAYRFTRAGGTGSAEIVWDGADANAGTIATTGLGSLDLTAGSQNAFLLGVLSCDQIANVTITTYSSSGTRSVTVGVPSGSTPNYFLIPYSTFTGSGAFTTVGAIQLTVNSALDGTLVIDFLRTASTTAVPLVEGLLTDIVLVDNDGNGKASPGDTLRYTVRITNNDTVAKTGVTFDASTPANTTPGPITTSPLARADGPSSSTSSPGETYHGTFNQPFSISSGQGLLLNDLLGSPAATISSFGVISYAGTSVGESVTAHPAGLPASFGGNSLTINSDGSVLLSPGSTFVGLIVFKYRLSNSAGFSDGTATIAIGVRPDARDDSYSALGNVQITQAAANGVLQKATADSGSLISVTTFGPNLAGVGTYNAGSPGLTLKGGNLTLNADGSFTYNPPPGFTGSDSFVYKINNGFNQPDTATVTITVSDLVWFINNTAPAGGDGRIGTPFNSLAAYNSSAPSKDAGDIIFIYQGSGSYSGSITLVNNQQLIGQGEDLATVANLTPPPGSASLPGAAAKPVLANAGTIVTLPGSSGVSTIRGLTLNPSAGFAILGNAAGTTTIANNSISPSGTGGGVSLTTQNGTFTLTSTPIAANSGSAALFLSGGSGDVTFDSSAISQSGAARIVDIQNRTGGTVTLAGNLTASGSSTGLRVANNNSGSSSFVFSGGTKTFNTGANAAVTVSGNTGATIAFSNGGSMAITTTSGTGFTATGGGTIAVTGSANTINSTSGTGLNVANTTIDASGLTFKSISAAGAANGIVLNNTGTVGGLTVTGDGSNTTLGGNFSGGTIANTTGSDGSTAGIGVYLNSTAKVTLRRMKINDHQNFAIYGNSVTDFTMEYSTVTSSGSNGSNVSFDEGSVSFSNLTGTSSILKSIIENGLERNFSVVNNTGSLNRIVFDDVTIGLDSTTLGSDGIFLQAQSGATLNATVQNSRLNGSRGDLFQMDVTGSGVGDLIFQNNTVNNTHSATVTGGGGITLSAGGAGSTGTFTFDINGGTFKGARGDAIGLFAQAGSATLSGKIRNTTIGVAATASSGSSEASAIEVRKVGGTTVSVTIDNNSIRQYSNFGILLQQGDNAQGTGGTFRATVSNNTIASPSAFVFAKNGIQVNSGTTVGDAYVGCFDIKNNTTAGSGTDGGTDIRVRHRMNTTVNLPAYAGSQYDTAAVAAYLQGRNTGVETASATTSSAGPGFVNIGACTTP